MRKSSLSLGIVSLKTWSLLGWFLIPLSILVVLILYPPHAFDMAVSRLFYRHGWFASEYVAVFSFAYTATKAIPGLIAVYLMWSWWVLGSSTGGTQNKTVRTILRKRIIYVLLAMLICGLIVDGLKQTTGVYCPWSMTAFGGDKEISGPVFGLTPVPGRCWPGGHAGTGFCLFALFFALRDFSERGARCALLFAIGVGLFASLTRLLQGAHFFSHNLSTLLIDWLVCATLYVLIFDRPTFFRKVRSILTARPTLAVSIGLTALWWTLIFNRPFFEGLTLKTTVGNAVFLCSLAGSFLALSLAVLWFASALLPSIGFRALLVTAAFCGAVAYVGERFYGTIFTPDMARNLIETDWREASAYFSLTMLLTFLGLLLPPILCSRFAEREETEASQGRYLKVSLKRMQWSVLFLLIGISVLFVEFQRFSGEMRTHRSIRYEIAPFNIPYSMAMTLVKNKSPDRIEKRLVIDPSPRLKKPEEPVFLAVFIGETTRAASWQLSGYERNTASHLALRNDLISFPEVLTCGSATDVSLPCMMSRIGRSDYDRKRILNEESLLNLVDRAGVRVEWIDNQSGCKGVCQGVPSGKPRPNDVDCPNGRCFDSVLVTELRDRLQNANPGETTVVFLHMYGSHGPAYYKGSRVENKAFFPECETADFGQCSKESIRNAYDNSVRETDAVLADAIAVLEKAANEKGLATGVVWVPDHGESLGEKGLFLHGAPYQIAPPEQIRVPMVMWFSDRFKARHPKEIQSLERRKKKSVTHEHLFSTLLSLLGVESTTYRPAYDLTVDR